MVELLRPKRGGFMRAIGCGKFIRDYLLGLAPFDSPAIDPEVGTPQADAFLHYKEALRRETAIDRATRLEEKKARQENRRINPENIEKLAQKILDKLPFKANGCRYHSFVTYFSDIQRLGWVEETGQEEKSAFQDNYPKGQPRKYFRLTAAGRAAKDAAWANPHRFLYGN